ncbi:uncharacterized protein AB675_1061 [Cyphellophora attinorum]|uniref:CorA-like transporter domain-containing protein n=1 Tax=Cyphellophora attinorum TaxID=1664694 RepID=A0A0N1H1M4_9EURO|nr:uncharacterized protein AB675_1061 [Phialophora attinorum]KPI38055.1 hypothetical protein AB675_1061 [Phialophora attinorum]
MATPDYSKAKWDYGYIPDYHSLTKETLEQRLKDKFGNWNFYVETRNSGFTRRDQNRMALNRFLHSCDRASQYPANLLDPGTGASILDEYVRRFRERINDDLRLFQPEVYANIGVHHYRDENGQRHFHEEEVTSLSQLKRVLSGGTAQPPKDSPCTLVFVGAESSRHPLKISKDMMLWLMTFYQVLPAFLDFLFAFGEKVHDLDFHSGGFRDDTRVGPGLARERLEALGRSGRDTQLCYNLKTFEAKPGLRWPWSSRQAAIFHSFDAEHGQASWIVIKANNALRDRLKELSISSLAKDHETYTNISKQFAFTLACHLVVIEWCGENWRKYLSDIEHLILPFRRRAVVDKVPKFVPEDISGQQEGQNIAMLPQQPRRDTLRQFALGSRNSTSLAAAAQTNAMPSPNPQLTGPVPIAATDLPREPPNLPPGYDAKVSSGTTTEDDQRTSQIHDLQDAQALENKVTEARLVLSSNISVLNQITAYYHDLSSCPDLPRSLQSIIQREVGRFVRRVSAVQGDLELHLARIENMSSQIGKYKDFLYSIVEYQAVQANLNFAHEAKHSANRMERMTKQMQEMTTRTLVETVSMRIITVVTVFFLPATFVSTLMSTDIVHYQPSDSSITSGSSSAGAVKLFVCLSLCLMAGTFAGGFGFWWAALSIPTTL